MPEPTGPAAPVTTPAATTTPAQVSTPAPNDFMGDVESDFGEMEQGKPDPSIARDEKGKFKPVDKTKPAAKPADEKPVEQSTDKPADEVTPPEKAEESAPGVVKPEKAASLREAKLALEKRVKEEYLPEIQRLKAKVQEYESNKPEDTAPIQAKIKALEERNTELEKHIEYVDFSQSDKFNKDYATPYKEAWTDAVNEFRELTVREPDGVDQETEQPKFKTRPADETDLLKLANMRLSEMDATATELFGPSAARAINHIQNLKKLSAAQNKALADAKVKAGEWKTQRTNEQQQRGKAAIETWARVNKSLEESFPKAFRVEEGNAEDAASHAKGFALADLMFLGNESLKPEQIEALPAAFRETVKAGKPLSEVQKVQLHALARLKMANHDRQVARNKKLSARLAEVEKSLAEYEKSEPATTTAGVRRPDSNKTFEQEVQEDLNKMDQP